MKSLNRSSHHVTWPVQVQCLVKKLKNGGMIYILYFFRIQQKNTARFIKCESSNYYLGNKESYYVNGFVYWDPFFFFYWLIFIIKYIKPIIRFWFRPCQFLNYFTMGSRDTISTKSNKWMGRLQNFESLYLRFGRLVKKIRDWD